MNFNDKKPDEKSDQHSKKEWPKFFFDYLPIEDVPDFKSLRNELKDNVPEDPIKGVAKINKH